MKQPRLRDRVFESAESHRLTALKTATLLLTLAFSILLNTGAIAIANPVLATVTSFVTVFVLPGFLLSGLAFGRGEMSWPERLPVSFVLGMGTLSLPAVLLLIVHSSVDLLNWISVAINVVVGGLYILRWQKDAGDLTSARSASDDRLNPFLLAASLLSIAVVVYVFLSTASPWSSFGDTWSCLFCTRHHLDLPHLAAIASPLSGTGSVSARAAFNGWWVLQAFMDRVAGVEPVDVYSFYLPPLLLVVSLLAFYSLARELFKNRNVALLATLIQVLYCVSSVGAHNWIGQGFFDRILEDKFLIWLLILPVAILFMLKYLSSGKGKHLLPLALSAAVLGLTHPMGLVQCGISFVSFALVHLLSNPKRDSIIRVIAIFILLLFFLLVPLTQRQMRDSARFDYTSGQETQFILSRTRLWIFSALENQYMAHPHLVAHPLTVLAILLTPLLIQYTRKSVAAQFLFSNNGSSPAGALQPYHGAAARQIDHALDALASELGAPRFLDSGLLFV